MMRYRKSFQMVSCLALSASVLLGVAACKGGEKPKETEVQPAAPAGAKPSPTGKVIVIETITDDVGNYYKPKEVTAEPGDVLRFTLVTGVHNVDFVPDSNPGVPDLPPVSAFLQLPGQTIDIVVPDAKGKRLYFQCDPHALLGMIGHVIVKD